MRLLKAFARQLGPLGLMPSIKGGTLVKEEELEDAISLVKKGQIEFRVSLSLSRVNEGAAIMNKIGIYGLEERASCWKTLKNWLGQC